MFVFRNFCEGASKPGFIKNKGGSPTALFFIFDNLFLYTSYKSCRKPIAGTGTPFGASLKP